MDLVNFVRCKIMFFKARFLVLAAVFQDFHCTVYLIFLTFFIQFVMNSGEVSEYEFWQIWLQKILARPSFRN